MNVEKICEYLNEIGILEYENINIFLNIYSKLNNKNFTSKAEKIKEALKIYLNDNFIKNNQTSILCESIISSYNNYQLISKYQSLNNMNNLLLTKLRNKYMLFFLNLSLYLLKDEPKNKKIKSKNFGKKSKSKKNIQKYDKYEEENPNINNENEELISPDDEKECTFTPQINKKFKGYNNNNINDNIESHVYYSPAFNISSKFPINRDQNSIYTNQSFYDNNMNNYSYSNLNISNDNTNERFYNQYGNRYNQFPEQQFNNEYNMNFNKNINYYNNRIIQPHYSNQNINMVNQNNSSFVSDNIVRNAEAFYNKELYFKQKVNDKIENLKFEKYNKMAKECTFKPKINSNYKSFYPQNKEKENLNDINLNIDIKNQTIQFKNKNEIENLKKEENKEKLKNEKKKRAKSEKKKSFKILEDLSLAKKKRTEKTKKLLKERNFTPKIIKNDKYKVKMSFEERRLKSIELKNKYKNAKKPENNENNNVQEILAPGEMVRFKEIKNNEQNNNVYENNNNDNINLKIDENNNNKLDININNNEENNLKCNDNNNEIKENNIMDSNNYEYNKEVNQDNNFNEIQNRNILIDKLKEEHKIGFKSKKIEENKEIITTSENNEIDKRIDTDNIEKEYNFTNFETKSKSLKNILKKNDE